MEYVQYHSESELNSICSRINQILGEPWRIVELTPSATTLTNLAIPENIIGIEVKPIVIPCNYTTKGGEGWVFPLSHGHRKAE